MAQLPSGERPAPTEPAGENKGRHTLGAVGQESSEETSVASKMPSRVSAAASVGAGRSPQATSAPRHAPQAGLRAHLAAKSSYRTLTKKSGTAKAIPDFLAGAEGLGLACRLGRFAAERHWRSLTPRHAVLEWMWESSAICGVFGCCYGMGHTVFAPKECEPLTGTNGSHKKFLCELHRLTVLQQRSFYFKHTR